MSVQPETLAALIAGAVLAVAVMPWLVWAAVQIGSDGSKETQ